jgi:hypothetical protein
MQRRIFSLLFLRRRTLLPSIHTMRTMGEYRDSNAVHRADGLRGLL